VEFIYLLGSIFKFRFLLLFLLGFVPAVWWNRNIYLSSGYGFGKVSEVSVPVPNPNLEPDPECISVPIPLGQKVSVPAVAVSQQGRIGGFGSSHFTLNHLSSPKVVQHDRYRIPEQYWKWGFLD
jgi:hypothetical protein